MKNTKTALLIATYNWVSALELILESVLKQTVLPDEILIADDGSTEETKQLIAHYKAKFTIPVHHIWHEDKGFRKAIILNKTIAKSISDYIIQIDGDCILHTNFVADHISFAEKRLYIYGTRVRIKKEYVPQFLNNKKIYFNFFSKGIKKRPRSLRIPFLSNWFSPQEDISPKFRGCNTSFWKSDFIKVNGYNENLEGWGREDSELMIRFHHLGIRARRLKFKGIIYHLDHSESSKTNFQKNDTIQQETLIKKRIWIEKGVNQYLK